MKSTKPRSNKHWHAMNGSVGYLPDSNDVVSTKADAISTLRQRFDDVTNTPGMMMDLKKVGIHYFGRHSRYNGADYCQVLECTDSECLEEEG